MQPTYILYDFFSIAGLYSRGHVTEDDYEVVVPMRVASDGGFISHAVSAKHRKLQEGRTKREAPDGGPDLDENAVDTLIHYNITVGGRPLRLNLRYTNIPLYNIYILYAFLSLRMVSILHLC